MELKHLQGNTYIINTRDASIGLYVFKDRSCLLIDSGANQTQAQEIMQLLHKQRWTVHAIFNTHAHADHAGGNHYIQEKSRCRIYASAIEAAFIQQPLLIPYSIYGAYPLKLLQAKFLMPQASQVTDTVVAGYVPINGDGFEVLDLGGHTLGHMGIRTPDNVIFAGDSLIAAEILKSTPFLYLANPEQQLITLEKFKLMDYSRLCLAHGEEQANTSAIVEANYAMLNYILDTLLNILQKPLSLEEIIQSIIARQSLEINRNHYFRLAASISAFLGYLCNHSQAKVCIKKSRMLYYC
jgi:glyoxylase-like metal-dependent hydrolase (beta-lactamase superfamily II)